ncbi:MAG: hypothetical protein JWM05_2895 [Acidimicrobiales bacterium]|nr:hypothetical protein [Acidimicrobiales bacterium]
MRRTLSTLAVAVLLVIVPVACSKSKGNKEAFCKQLKVTPALSEALTGFSADDPTTLRTKLDGVNKAFADLERQAPREIRSDVSEVTDLVGEIVKVVQANTDNPAAIQKGLRTLAASRTGAAKAALRLAAYGKDQCKVDLNATDGGATSAPPATTTTTAPPTSS